MCKLTKFVLLFSLVFSLLLGFSSSSWAQDIPYSGERIVVVADGNEHGKGDWAATPLSLALLAAKEIQDQVMVYAFSSHTWGSNKTHAGADAQMRESAFLGARNFGFKKTKFIEAVNAPNYAIIEITFQINKSSAKNPLVILAAGPMDIIGTALGEADSTKLKYVRLISHSSLDQRHADSPEEGETHSGWTWEKLQDSYQGKGLKLIALLDRGEEEQSFKAPLSGYAWLKDSAKKEPKPFQKGSWQWVYSRLEAAKSGEEVNPEDVRLMLYLITGNANTSIQDLRGILENPSKWD
ncbi:MAG: hypothetical protein O2829_07585 [Bacteroidetes bacterium]|nr:hypothetical protein [Bacteroidota bacterium]